MKVLASGIIKNNPTFVLVLGNWQNGTPKGTNSKEIVKRNVGF